MHFWDYTKEVMSTTQYRSWVTEHMIVIILFCLLLILALTHIWQVLYKQGRWSTLPLTFFYIFAVISISLRIVEEIA